MGLNNKEATNLAILLEFGVLNRVTLFSRFGTESPIKASLGKLLIAEF
jgi:hypothetical protein